VTIGAESPDDEDRLLEAHRRLDADAGLHLALAGIPPPVPGPGRDGELLSHRQRAFLTVEHERGSVPDLYVLGKVVVHMLAAGDKPARLDGEVGDNAGATGLLRGLDDHGLLAGQRVPDDVAHYGRP
jgi:hypothetical protein